TLSCGDGGRRCTLGVGERLFEQGGSIGYAGDDSGAGEVVGGGDVESASGGGLGEAVSLGGGGELSGEVLHGGAGLLLLDDGDDLGLDLGDGTEVRGVFIFDLQDVISELGFDEVRGLADWEREGSLVELRNGLAGF